MTGGHTKQVLGSFAWLFTGSGSMSILRILVVVFLARLLSPRDFGLLGAGMLVVSFSEMFVSLGVGPALVQIQELNPRMRRTGFTLSLILSILMSLPLWFGAPLVAAFFRMPDLVPVVRWLTATLPLNALAVVAVSTMERELRFREIAIFEAIAFAIGYGLVSILLASAGWGVEALVCAALVQTGLRTGLFLAFQPHEKSPLLDTESLRQLVPFTSGYALTRVAAFFALQGDNLVVGRWLGGQALGFYSRAYTLAAAPVNLLARALGRALFPKLSEVQQDKQKLASAFRQTLAALALATLPASATLFLVGSELVDLLLGAGWAPVAAPFRILAVGLFFRSGHKICVALISATGAVYQLASLYALYAVAILFGAWFGQKWGLPGVALAILAAASAHLLLMTRLSLKLTALTWKNLGKSLIPALSYTGLLIALVAPWAAYSRAAGAPGPLILTGAAAANALVFTLFYVTAARSTFGSEQRDLLLLLFRRPDRGKR